jgi:Protein of unknown function (DUF559)
MALADSLSLPDLLARYPRRRGSSTIRAILADGRTALTRSELEDRFLALLDATDLSRPEVNACLELAGGWIEVDCAWRAHRLVVELDGHATHATRATFERDRSRDRMLLTTGWRVVRITWRQLHDRPAVIAADLRRLLGAR